MTSQHALADELEADLSFDLLSEFCKMIEWFTYLLIVYFIVIV